MPDVHTVAPHGQPVATCPKPQRQDLYYAVVETRNFTFDAFGKSDAEARKALGQVIRKHAKQYGIPPDWARELLNDEAGNVTVRHVRTGEGYRNNDEAS